MQPAEFKAELAMREGVVSTLAARMMRFALEADPETVFEPQVFSDLPPAMLAGILDSAECDDALRRALSFAVTRMRVNDSYRMTLDALACVTSACPKVRSLTIEGSGPVVEALCKESATLFRSLHVLHLSDFAHLDRELVETFFAGNPELKELRLPGKCTDLRGVVIPFNESLKTLHFAGKVDSDVMVEFLLKCRALSNLHLTKRERKISLSLMPGITAAKVSSLYLWGRTFAVSLKASHVHRYFGKVFFRGALKRDHKVLEALLQNLHMISGQPSNAILQMLRKLGPDLLDTAVAGYVEAKQYSELFQLLLVTDKWDNYDPKSTLGTLVFGMRRRLMSESPVHFRKFVNARGRQHLPTLLHSLEGILRPMLERFRQDEPKFLLKLASAVRSLLVSGNANPYVVEASAVLMSMRMDDPKYVSELLDELRGLLSKMQDTPAPPVQAYLLLLVAEYQPALLEELRSDFASLRSFRIVNIDKVLNKTLIQRLVAFLPETLKQFAIRYATRLGEPIQIDDTLLAEMSQKWTELEALELDLTPKITNAGVAMLVKGCPQLSVLQLRSTRVDDSGVQSLEGLKRLRVLRMECKVRDLTLSRLASCLSSLVCIDLFSCPYSTLHGVEKIVANSERLRELHIGSCRQINIDMLKQRQIMKLLKAKPANAGKDVLVVTKSGVVYK